MPLTVTPDTTTFTDIYNQYKPGVLGRGKDQHVRGGESASGAAQVYTHNPLMPKGRGEAALARRLEKYESGAGLVRQAMVHQYGEATTEAAFRRVSAQTGRDLDTGVTRGDLARLKTELDTMAREERRATGPEVVRDYAAAWSSDARRVQAHHYDAGATKTLYLPPAFNRDFVENGDIRIEGGKLRLQTPRDPGDVRSGVDRREANLEAITSFIQEEFGFEPGSNEFNNVANNLFRYVQAGAGGSASREVHAVTGGQARLASDLRTTFTIEADTGADGEIESVDIGCAVDASVVGRATTRPDRFAGSPYSQREQIRIDPGPPEPGIGGGLGTSTFDAARSTTGTGRVATAFLPRPPG